LSTGSLAHALAANGPASNTKEAAIQTRRDRFVLGFMGDILRRRNVGAPSQVLPMLLSLDSPPFARFFTWGRHSCLPETLAHRNVCHVQSHRLRAGCNVGFAC